MKHFWAVLVIIALVLTACNGAKPASAPTAVPELITLRFGIIPPFLAAFSVPPELEQAITLFEQENPSITVEVVPIPIGNSAAVRLDELEALQLDAFLTLADPALVDRGTPLALGLDNYVSTTPGFSEQDFEPYLLNAFRWQGKLYAIPADLAVVLVYYNRDMFDAEGVAYPSPDWDIQDFLSIAQQMTTIQEGDEENGHWGFISNAWSAEYLIFAMQHGGTIFNDLHAPTGFVFDDPLAIEALQFYADLGLVYKVQPVQPVDKPVEKVFYTAADAFAGKRAAMVLGTAGGGTGPDQIKWNFNWGVVPFPGYPNSSNKPPIVWLVTNGLFVGAQTTHPDAAWALVRSLSENEAGITMLIPARRSVAESEATRQRIGAELLDASLRSLNGEVFTGAYDQRILAPFIGVMGEAFQVLDGSMTAEELMAQWQTEFANWSPSNP